jgi:hypothetical protein
LQQQQTSAHNIKAGSRLDVVYALDKEPFEALAKQKNKHKGRGVAFRMLFSSSKSDLAE